MINPFNQTDNERLYNIAIGKAASLYTEEVLLTVDVSKCMKRLNKFIKRPERFEEKIAKQKMQTFETELGRKNSEIPMEKFSQSAFCVTYLAVFCAFLRRKRLMQ